MGKRGAGGRGEHQQIVIREKLRGGSAESITIDVGFGQRFGGHQAALLQTRRIAFEKLVGVILEEITAGQPLIDHVNGVPRLVRRRHLGSNLADLTT